MGFLIMGLISAVSDKSKNDGKCHSYKVAARTSACSL